jgi:hypothetical protein
VPENGSAEAASEAPRPRRSERSRRTRREVYVAELAAASTAREELAVEMRALLALLGRAGERPELERQLKPLVKAVRTTREHIDGLKRAAAGG